MSTRLRFVAAAKTRHVSPSLALALAGLRQSPTAAVCTLMQTLFTFVQ
jgi:hypothetical protein